MQAAETNIVRSSRDEYRRRIHRVLAHVDAHLDEPLPLDKLAAVANFSPFHFHRLFAAWTGETLGDYLRRRRVEVAAMRLATQPRLTVLQGALAVGFGSSEAFARAFRQRIGASPSAWRRLRKIDQVQRNADQAADGAGAEHEASSTSRAESRMKVNLIERVPTSVAYFRYTGPLGAPVEKFWMQQVAPWLAENNLFGRERYGVSHDDPSITDASKCRYDACVELEPEAIVSGRPLRTTLPGGRYACMHFEGTSGQIDAAWRSLLRDWLPDSGLQLDARACLEHYPLGAKFDAATGVFDCELCIPVSPL